MPNCILKQWLNSYSLCVSCKFHSPLSFIFKGFSSPLGVCQCAVEMEESWSHCWLGIWGLPLQGAAFNKIFHKSTSGFSFYLICWNLVTGSLLGTIQPKNPVYCKEDQDSTCGLEQWYFTTWEHFITWKHCHPLQVRGVLVARKKVEIDTP